MSYVLGEIVPFRDLLSEIGELQHEATGWLFLPQNDEWTLDSPAALMSLNEVPPNCLNSEDVATPKLAKENKMKRVLAAADVQDIVDNVRQQVTNASMEEIFGAFFYYYRFDAFKNFSDIHMK